MVSIHAFMGALSLDGKALTARITQSKNMAMSPGTVLSTAQRQRNRNPITILSTAVQPTLGILNKSTSAHASATQVSSANKEAMRANDALDVASSNKIAA
jgi:hypothetical protein